MCYFQFYFDRGQENEANREQTIATNEIDGQIVTVKDLAQETLDQSNDTEAEASSINNIKVDLESLVSKFKIK